MNIAFKRILPFALTALCGCSSDAVNLGFKKDLSGFNETLAEIENKKQAAMLDEVHSAVAERIAPIGKVTMKSDLKAVSIEGVTSGTSPKVQLSGGSEHTVKMLNAGDGGTMIFEPAVIRISKGDTIHFKATDLSHNAASIEGMIPDGATPWAGLMNQDISVTFETEGVYVYQCDPHVIMAMVGVVQVGEAVNISAIRDAAEEFGSRFVMNNNRLNEYLGRL
jgi:pseudoazurin